MDITCPGCQRTLRVPDGSVGRRARCPACSFKFVVPDPKDELEATISGWIVEDFSRAQALKQRHDSLRYRPAAASPSRPARP